MKVKMLFLTVAMFFGLSSLHAQQNALIGTWKINIGKSKASNGGPLTDLRSRTDTYEFAAPDGIRYSSEETTTDGKTRRTTYSAQFDGKFYPMSGSPNAGDHVSLKRVDAFNTESRFQRDGKDTGAVSTRSVSPDGKTMTYKGGRGTLVFDKQ